MWQALGCHATSGRFIGLIFFLVMCACVWGWMWLPLLEFPLGGSATHTSQPSLWAAQSVGSFKRLSKTHVYFFFLTVSMTAPFLVCFKCLPTVFVTCVSN